MIWVSLQSESPWQRNDAITFFICLCFSLYQVFFNKSLKDVCTCHKCFYYGKVWTISLRVFGNEVLRIIKTLKPHGENIHSYPHFPFFHRSFIYRKAFLYMAVNCGKFENIPVPAALLTVNILITHKGCISLLHQGTVCLALLIRRICTDRAGILDNPQKT